MDQERYEEDPDLRRPVDWRFLKAEQLAEIDSLRPEQVTDVGLQLAVRYLRAERTPQVKAKGADTVVLDQAFAMYRENGPLRWELESRILAGQTDADIGARCNLDPNVIGLYEILFFDVRSRRSAMYFLRHYVIGPGLGVPLKKEHVREFWAHEAIVSGLPALDHAVEEFHRVRSSGGPLTLNAYSRRGVPLDLKDTVAYYRGHFGASDCRIGLQSRLIATETNTPEEVEKEVLGVRRSKVRPVKDVIAGKPTTPRRKRRKSRESPA